LFSLRVIVIPFDHCCPCLCMYLVHAVDLPPSMYGCNMDPKWVSIIVYSDGKCSHFSAWIVDVWFVSTSTYAGNK